MMYGWLVWCCKIFRSLGHIYSKYMRCSKIVGSSFKFRKAVFNNFTLASLAITHEHTSLGAILLYND